jgi:hypothetical protein
LITKNGGILLFLINYWQTRPGLNQKAFFPKYLPDQKGFHKTRFSPFLKLWISREISLNISKPYRVTLVDEERERLTKITKDGKTPAKRFLNTRALLLCDASEGTPG